MSQLFSLQRSVSMRSSSVSLPTARLSDAFVCFDIEKHLLDETGRLPDWHEQPRHQASTRQRVNKGNPARQYRTAVHDSRAVAVLARLMMNERGRDSDEIGSVHLTSRLRRHGEYRGGSGE